MSNTKALFFDIDGTLLTAYPHRVPQSAITALKAAQAKGHKLFINSGRTLALIPPIMEELGFDGYVYGCGSQIYVGGKQIYSNSIPHELCIEVIKKMKECRLSAVLESSDRLLFDGSGDVLWEFVERLRTMTTVDDISTFDKEEAQTFTFAKFYSHIIPDSDVKKFREFSDPYFTCFEHGSTELEFTLKGCDKASGIQKVLDYLGLSPEDSYAFGDSSNDLAMLKYAGTSIAMGNSSPEIVPYCTYQTTDIEDDGILNALKHFDLI